MTTSKKDNIKAEDLRLQANALLLQATRLDGKSDSVSDATLTRARVNNWLKKKAEYALTKHYRLNDQQLDGLAKLWPVINELDIDIEAMMPLMDLIWLSWLHQKYNGNANQFMISAGAEMASRVNHLTRGLDQVMGFNSAEYHFIAAMNASLNNFT